MIALPVATASWLNAHCLGYVLAPPDAGGAMHQHHTEQGHAYFGSLPVFVAAGLTLLAAGLVLCVGEGVRGGPSRSQPPARLFALLLPLGFVVQEHLESLLAHGSVPYDLAAEPTFLAGLVLQLPFAVGALLLTRALSALGYGLGRLLARTLPDARASSRLLLPVTRLVAPAALVAVVVLAPGHGPRAPPAAA